MGRIQPIVEGHGEVEAVPVLVRRLIAELKLFDLDVGKPIRRKRSELTNEGALRTAVKLAKKQPDCSAILVMFDSDDDCPKDLAPQLTGWAASEAGAMPCEVVMAHREYEAWFLASMESLRGSRGIRTDAALHPSPEAVRGAKERLQECMLEGFTYSEKADQPALTQMLDMAAAYTCRSFRHLVAAFGRIAVALGCEVTQWPPATWRQISQ